MCYSFVKTNSTKWALTPYGLYDVVAARNKKGVGLCLYCWLVLGKISP